MEEQTEKGKEEVSLEKTKPEPVPVASPDHPVYCLLQWNRLVELLEREKQFIEKKELTEEEKKWCRWYAEQFIYDFIRHDARVIDRFVQAKKVFEQTQAEREASQDASAVLKEQQKKGKGKRTKK